MVPYRYLIALIIVAILVLCAASTVGWYEKYLFGFWAASDDEFCDSAGVASIMLFIGAPQRSGYSTQRDGYLVVMDDFTNQGFTITYTPPLLKLGLGKYCISAQVEFDDEQIWDDTVTIETDITRGTMVIRSGDTVYARLYKQHDISNAACDAL